MIRGNQVSVRRVLRLAIRGALAGLLSAAVALGVAELVAGITGPLSSPVIAVGGVAINLTPVPLKDFAIAHFGSNDKNVLLAGIVVQLAIFAAVIGMLAIRWLWLGLAGLAVFGALGVAAVISRSSASLSDVAPTLIGVAVAAVAMVFLVRAARMEPRRAATVTAAGSADPQADLAAPDLPVPQPGMRVNRLEDGDQAVLAPGRRRFLALGAGAAVLAAGSGWAGEQLLRRFNVTALRAAVRLPRPAVAAAPVPAGASLNVSGITPFFTSDNSFYRVDTNLVVPQVSPQDWTLQITGMVDHPIELSFDDLLRLPLIEHDMTLVCVSNAVGGPYAGNARWLGASLPALLRKAGIRRGADQVLSTGTDGMTISTAVDTILDGRQALIAVGMNGQPLPTEHGFPARMLVPGLYGYVSATKWITKLEVTTFAAPAGVLDPARLRLAGADQDRVADRRAAAARAGPGGPGRGRRGRLGAASRHLAGAGERRRRRVAHREASRRRWHRHLAAVGVALGCLVRPAHPAGPRHRRHRRRPDQERGRGVPERGHRLGLGGGHGDLTRRAPAAPWPTHASPQVAPDELGIAR